MLLKRIYKEGEVGRFNAECEAAVLPSELAAVRLPAVSHVRVLRAGRKQKFSPDLVATGAAQGWLSMAGGRITLHAEDGEHVYRVVRVPGTYCCHCGVSVHDAGGARAHIAAEHEGATSPDPENPSGYMRTHAFKGVRESAPATTGED